MAAAAAAGTPARSFPSAGGECRDPAERSHRRGERRSRRLAGPHWAGPAAKGPPAASEASSATAAHSERPCCSWPWPPLPFGPSRSFSRSPPGVRASPTTTSRRRPVRSRRSSRTVSLRADLAWPRRRRWRCPSSGSATPGTRWDDPCTRRRYGIDGPGRCAGWPRRRPLWLRVEHQQPAQPVSRRTSRPTNGGRLTPRTSLKPVASSNVALRAYPWNFSLSGWWFHCTSNERTAEAERRCSWSRRWLIVIYVLVEQPGPLARGVTQEITGSNKEAGKDVTVNVLPRLDSSRAGHSSSGRETTSTVVRGAHGLHGSTDSIRQLLHSRPFSYGNLGTNTLAGSLVHAPTCCPSWRRPSRCRPSWCHRPSWLRPS